MAKRLQANDLNRRITLQKKGRTEDEAGYPIPGAKEWEDVIILWAKREPLRGREFFAAAAAQAEGTVRYKIRYRSDISSDMRLTDGKKVVNEVEMDRVYEITAVLDDVFDDRTETHILVTEASNG
ncbi:phage head closure protein [Paenibacillus dokdonensis]|uniref:Phage head closure protein n=1 Tax=Paenibacillus dokdonensis TaxID=2567944 RepID=A0ABU6GSS4_9BACL|nr:phage head closure protein [Paenibacillus dokdonensis]MEC0242769.1 phage head closure protein [Paenibacillus dokdonensis]